MANTLYARIDPNVTIRLSYDLAQASLIDQIVSGREGFTSLLKELSYGSGSVDSDGFGRASKFYHQRHRIGGGSTLALDLQTIADVKSDVLIFTLVKYFLIRIVSPSSGSYLEVGGHPTVPWLAWFASTSSAVRVEEWEERIARYSGWPVTDTSRNLRVYNPGASALDCDIVMLGE